jgi:hypothetical protein
MQDWHFSEESDLPLWVRELDDALYSVEHRRLCVWQDEFDATWRWEIQTYAAGGVAGAGLAASRAAAMQAAEAAARRLGAGTQGS